MHKHTQHACTRVCSMFLPGRSLKISPFSPFLKYRSCFSFSISLSVSRWRTHVHALVRTHKKENFNSICRGRNQSHISLVNPQWLSTDPDTNKVLSRWGQGLRRRTEGEERPAVWGPTGGWHCSSAIMGLVYGREGCRKEAAEIEGRERGIEKERERGGGGKNWSHLWYDG